MLQGKIVMMYVKINLADKICLKIFSYGTDLYKFALSSILLASAYFNDHLHFNCESSKFSNWLLINNRKLRCMLFTIAHTGKYHLKCLHTWLYSKEKLEALTLDCEFVSERYFIVYIPQILIRDKNVYSYLHVHAHI